MVTSMITKATLMAATGAAIGTLGLTLAGPAHASNRSEGHERIRVSAHKTT